MCEKTIVIYLRLLGDINGSSGLVGGRRPRLGRESPRAHPAGRIFPIVYSLCERNSFRAQSGFPGERSPNWNLGSRIRVICEGFWSSDGVTKCGENITEFPYLSKTKSIPSSTLRPRG